MQYGQTAVMDFHFVQYVVRPLAANICIKVEIQNLYILCISYKFGPFWASPNTLTRLRSFVERILFASN